MTQAQHPKAASISTRPAVRAILLILAYFATGWLGLQIPYIGSHITLVWVPTGIAVAALLRWGRGIWPGIYLGAFFVNLSIGSAWPLAAGIALGNTLGPMLTVAWLRGIGFHSEFDRQQDVASFLVAASLGMIVSAGGGVAALHWAGILPIEALGWAGLSWWMGDTVGVLLAAPLLLTLTRRSVAQLYLARGELLLWLLVAAPVAWLAFIHDYQEIGHSLPLAFLTLPMFAWAALRFGNTLAQLAGLAFSVVAAWGTARGHGTFFLPQLHLGLFLLWAYMATTVLTGLLITALQAERQKTAATLRDSEERFRLLAAATFEGIAITEEGCFSDANDQLLAMLGYARGELIGMRIMDLLPAEDGERVMDNIRSGRESRIEHAIVRKDGGLLQVEAHGQNVMNGGRTIRITALRDITERKRAEADLRRSSEKNLALLRNASDGIHILDRDGNVLEASDSFCTMLGYPRDEVIGMNVSRWDANFTAEELVEKVRQQFAAPVRSEFETRHRRKDGMIFDVEVSGYPLELDGHPVLFNSSRDITKRRQLEAELEQHHRHLEELVQQRTAALLETEARASHILHSSADGLYGVDHDGTITFINPAACAMLGCRADQVIGRSAHSCFHHSKPDGTSYPIDQCPSHNAVRMGEKIRIDNEVYWHADGHAIPVMYAVHPMVQQGVNSGAVISFVDMSEQRAAAEAREHALLAAENLARVRSEFLANMSHEIRTPLNGVLGFAQIGYRNYQNSDKARDAFSKILLSGDRLLGVINDILDFSKIEAGKLSIEQTDVALAEVVDHAMALVGDRALAKQLALRLEMAPDLPRTCLSDPLRMGQVLLNVLANAIKFTERGGVTVQVSRQGGALVFRVTDTGIGMSETQRSALFTPFQQADASATRRFGGTGLGLTISKRILDLMHGSIVVHSQPGVGTSVEFQLPYVPSFSAPAVPQGLPGSAEAGARGLVGISILVAEDEVINQAILEETLRDEGARVMLVGNGRDAVDCVRRDGTAAYDIVLLDIQMPEMDGYEAARRIREMAADLPIVAQTAHAFGEERERCLAAGMVDHIAKPIDPAALVALIRQHARKTLPARRA